MNTILLKTGCALFLIVGLGSVRAGDLPRVAWLGAGTEAGSAEFVMAFKEGLRENGLVEGKHYVFDARYCDTHYDRFPALVQDLLSRNPSVIVAVTVSSVRAAQRATRVVPIVMMATTDPVRSGLVKTLARPGGNTTGFGNMAEDLSDKYVQFFREIRPAGRRIGVLINPKNPSSQPVFHRIEAAARRQGLTTERIEFAGSSNIRVAFSEMARRRPDGLALIADYSYLDRRTEICQMALRHKIPVLGFAPDFADAGCAVGFGSPRKSIFRRSAAYVRKIIDGAEPAELPIELPVTFELVINVQTVKALGLTIPGTLLQRADRLIE